MRGTFAKVGVLAWPELGAHAQVLSVLGMAAFFAGSVRAPLTGIVLVSEMTGGYDLLFPICIAVLAAYLVAEGLGDAPIYDHFWKPTLNAVAMVYQARSHARCIWAFSRVPGWPASRSRTRASARVHDSLVGAKRCEPSALPETVLIAGDHVSILMPGETPDVAMEIVRLCTGT